MKSWLQTSNNVPKSWKSSLVAQMVKNLPAMQETQVWPLHWEDTLVKEWPPTPVSLPRKSHGQRSLRGYNPWGCKQSDTAERLILSLCYWGTSKKMANHTPSNVTKGSKHDPNPSDKEKKFLCNNRPRRSNCAFSGVIHKRPSLLIVSAFPLGEKMVFSQSIVY